MGVSNRIKELRERAGLSQIELANMVGVDANTVWRWENDRSSPSRSIQSLASALKTSVAYLMGETDDPVRYDSSLLMAAGKKPEELDGNKPPEPSSDLARRKHALREWFDKKDASSSLGLAYWASVVDNVRDAASHDNPQELAEIREMLEKALASIDDAYLVRQAEGEKNGSTET